MFKALTLAPMERNDWISCAALIAFVGVLFLGAPTGGAFDWSDAPRHALNGVFVKDFFAAMPVDDPRGFAESYYLQYPALTILFYPPLFYFVSAPFYAIFGVSQETALVVVELHYIAFAIGTYYLFRYWLEPSLAFAAALTLIAAPEIAFWGRQVMLEIPAFAFLVWSLVALVHHLRRHTPWTLYLCIALLVLAIYTKLSAAFLAPAIAIALFRNRGMDLFRDKHSYIIAALSIVGLVPLAILTLKFGQANVQSVSGIADAEVSRATLQGWLWYAKQIPGQIGWAACAAALLGGAYWIAMRRTLPTTAEGLLWLAWFGIGYIFFSAIDLKEARHSVFILPPIIFAAALSLRAALPSGYAAGALMAVALATLAQTIVLRPVHFVDGYAAVVDRIAQLAPRDSVVMFSGYRDGAFTFSMRAREDRRDLSVLRADKLLLRIAVRRTLGVEQKALSEAEIATALDRNGVHYVVAQPGFWTDLAAMQRFENVLHSPQFVEVARVPTHSNYPAHERELVIYRNLGKVAKGPIKLEIELPIIGGKVTGAIGSPE